MKDILLSISLIVFMVSIFVSMFFDSYIRFLVITIGYTISLLLIIIAKTREKPTYTEEELQEIRKKQELIRKWLENMKENE